MESSLISAGVSILSICKSLNSHPYPLIAHFNRRFSTATRIPISLLCLTGSCRFLRGTRSGYLCRERTTFIARYTSPFISGGGIDGGGERRAEVGEVSPDGFAAGPIEGISSSSEVIILEVGGMSCGGCAASVKRILESQPQVSSASVNLATETALVWPIYEVKSKPNWQKDIGEALAKHLTSCGFQSNLKDFRKAKAYQTFEKKIQDKQELLKESGRGLALSWALCAVCALGHLSHFGVHSAWIHALHSTRFSMSLSLFTLLGPGRQLIMDGLKSLVNGTPNMNTLVGLGALSSFAVSSLASFLPKLGWNTFFEEPVMLIAFVLLGRNLEQRAKISAASDMAGLLSILPSKARLVVNSDSEGKSSIVEVPADSLSVGDQVVVLPGDRIPADGIVREGRSSADESSFTGEPLPVTKLPGAEVVAGSINLNGKITVEVQRPGGETAIADIIRLVEEAQTREPPVQRLADKVAGYFTYGVMGLSAATLFFWGSFGRQIIPAALQHGSYMSLAIQLSCSVLVVACPCALGLATPTAVLIGTSLGARKGLLLRGGNILEKFAAVDTIVFDKTGTLTIGKPTVMKVVTNDNQGNLDKAGTPDATHKWSEAKVLELAAGVESSTIHPIGKAIVEAARISNCPSVKVEEGSFYEEPGSGAVGTIDAKKVTVGTMEWVQRHGVDCSSSFNEADEFKNQSVVYVGVNDVLAGVIYVEDKVREDSRSVIESLHRQGITTYLLSGDKKSAAQYVASVVGIPNERVVFSVKPHEKKQVIDKLVQSGNIVAMVGDGINDAAALASSHVGVAIGGSVGAASEVSSIVLMQNKLYQLLDALELSRLTMKTVKQNLGWAFLYNIIGIPVAAGALVPVSCTILSPSIAGALMGLSSVGVMTNSLLLRAKYASYQKHSRSSSQKSD